MKMLKLRFKLQKNQSSKLQKNVKKKVKLHTCALEHAFVQKKKKSKKPKNILKTKKKAKKIFLFLINFNFKNFLQPNFFYVTFTS